MRIAILEDDLQQAELLRLWLIDAGHDVTHFSTGESCKRGMSHESYDLVILDWMLPDTNGIDILLWLREQKDYRGPILFITQRDSEEDIVQALEAGADEYIVKPVKQLETLARIRALTRRVQPDSSQETILNYGDYEVDLANRIVRHNDEIVDLTNKEFDLTLFLFRNIGRVVSRSYMLESVWGRSGRENTRTVDTHISRIRNKLGFQPETGWRLNAIYQHGYRLEQLEPGVLKKHA